MTLHNKNHDSATPETPSPDSLGNVSGELKTSAEWQELNPDIRVLDPDGWDRKNFRHSWHEELITYEEYQNRLIASTCEFHGLPEALLNQDGSGGDKE